MHQSMLNAKMLVYLVTRACRMSSVLNVKEVTKLIKKIMARCTEIPSVVWECKPHDTRVLWRRLPRRKAPSSWSCRRRMRWWLSAGRVGKGRCDMAQGTDDSRTAAVGCRPATPCPHQRQPLALLGHSLGTGGLSCTQHGLRTREACSLSQLGHRGQRTLSKSAAAKVSF